VQRLTTSADEDVCSQSSLLTVDQPKLFPLALLLFTGLYLFILPYGAKWRR
jgi:hypothetical protein